MLHQNLIIRIGGMIPTFITPTGNFSCFPNEAQVFTSIDDAKKVASTYNGNSGCKIVDADTLKFICWGN
jgi:hypothetical protein